MAEVDSRPAAYSVEQFKKTFSLGTTSVYALIKSGQITAVKAGAKTLITSESAWAWFNSLPRGVRAA